MSPVSSCRSRCRPRSAESCPSTGGRRPSKTVPSECSNSPTTRGGDPWTLTPPHSVIGRSALQFGGSPPPTSVSSASRRTAQSRTRPGRAAASGTAPSAAHAARLVSLGSGAVSGAGVGVAVGVGAGVGASSAAGAGVAVGVRVASAAGAGVAVERWCGVGRRGGRRGWCGSGVGRRVGRDGRRGSGDSGSGLSLHRLGRGAAGARARILGPAGAAGDEPARARPTRGRGTASEPPPRD